MFYPHGVGYVHKLVVVCASIVYSAITTRWDIECCTVFYGGLLGYESAINSTGSFDACAVRFLFTLLSIRSVFTLLDPLLSSSYCMVFVLQHYSCCVCVLFFALEKCLL